MTPGARVQAAIECLDDIFAGAPAEKTMTRWARRSRFAGSKDRAAVRDHVFDALRNRDSLAALGGGLTGRAVMIALALREGQDVQALFNGIAHAPSVLSAEEDGQIAQVRERGIDAIANDIWDMPDDWAGKLLASHPQNAQAIAHALRDRAPVDLRVNLRKMGRDAALTRLAQEGITAQICDISSTALRITEGARALKNSRSYLDGLVELQDAGSQALVEALPLKESMQVLDYCAGGGGKSLAIAGLAEARIFAHDSDEGRMKDIPARAARAGVKVDCVNSSGALKVSPFDLVLCDAPCSGSGAWRRSPDAKWRLTQEAFQTVLQTQREILLQAKTLVGQSGYLAYATCSLFAEENEEQVNEFLKDTLKFKLIFQKSWTPLDGCDGFHVSVMQLESD